VIGYSFGRFRERPGPTGCGDIVVGLVSDVITRGAPTIGANGGRPASTSYGVAGRFGVVRGRGIFRLLPPRDAAAIDPQPAMLWKVRGKKTLTSAGRCGCLELDSENRLYTGRSAPQAVTC